MDADGSANATGSTAGEDLDAILGRLDADFSRSMALVYVYVAMVMVTGLLGNLLVVVVYVTNFKATTTRSFIVALAASDLVSCAVVMPLDFVELFTSSTVVCKALRCFVTLTYTFSGYVTLVMAVDRYRRICRPFASQLTVQGANRAIMGSFVVAVAFTWPQIFISGEQQEVAGGLNVTKTKCGWVKYPDGVPYHVIFYACLFLPCLAGGVAMVTLYSIIGWKMQKRKRLYGNSPSRQDEATATTTSTNDVPDQTAADVTEGVQLQPGRICRVPHSDSPKHLETDSSSLPHSGPCQNGDHSKSPPFGLTDYGSGEHRACTRLQEGGTHQAVESLLLKNCQPAGASSASRCLHADIAVSGDPDGQDARRVIILEVDDSADKEDFTDLQGGSTNYTGQRHMRQRESSFRKMTFSLFLVTLVYILSFLPCFVMRMLSARKVLDGLGGAPLAVIEMPYRSLYLQSATNAVIYGARHGEFRAKCRRLLKSRK